MDFIALLPLALFLGFVGLMAFMWTLRSGQYDDLDGAAWRAIMDDDEELIPTQEERNGPAKNDNNPQKPVDNHKNTVN